MSDADPQPTTLNLGAQLGADEGFSTQSFSLYVPNKDKNDQEFGHQRRWVLDAIRLLSEINGGATAVPVEGGWVDDSGRVILEEPVIVYSYVKTEPFLKNLTRIREFLHRLGRETNQGEIAFEFDGVFHRIRRFDTPASEGGSQ
jgi:hypothetical protein